MIIDFKKYPYPERLRHHTTPYNYIPLNELKGTPEFYPPLYNNIDWRDIFINGKKPDILDVGCGKAGLLLQFAENNPEINILGMEVRDTLAYWAENLIHAENIKNAAVIW
jgi:tRNA G46 methylase TrmB